MSEPITTDELNAANERLREASRRLKEANETQEAAEREHDKALALVESLETQRE
jgi:hypothetical protein